MGSKMIEIVYRNKETNEILHIGELEDTSILEVEVIKSQEDVITNDDDESRYVSSDYKKLRALEYPKLEEQMDTIFHSGIDVWKQQIQAIKDKYPKDV